MNTPPREQRPARAWVWGAWMTGALLLNEIFCNVVVMNGRLANAKLIRSVPMAGDLLGDVLAQGVLMLALTAGLTAIVGFAWGGVATAAQTALGARLRCLPCPRLLFAFVSAFTFLHLWYSLNEVLLPGSRLVRSPLAMLVGSLQNPLPFSVGNLWLTAVSAAMAVGLLGVALARAPRLRYALVAGGLAVVAAAGIYGRATAPGPPKAIGADGSVVLLGVDSFQMNRLALGGHPENLAPNINAFLAESRRFDNAWTPIARTYASWLSILTGREPVRHGARFNLVPDEALAADNPYLPGLLREHGYTTFHATDETRFSVIRPKFGFDGLMHPRMGLPDLVLGSFFDFAATNLARQTALGHDLFPAIANNRASASYSPSLFVRNLIKRLDELPTDEPLFLAIHLCGNHWPFSASAPYSWRTDDKVEQCVMMVDDQVGALLDRFAATGLRDRATVFLLSDHGDGWSGRADDDTNTHGDHFNSVRANQVLLGVQGPGIVPGVTRSVVRTTDIHPTVLELAGLEASAASVDGESLLPALRGDSLEPRRAFAETGVSRQTYTVKRLVQENARWYGLDPSTGLMQLKPEGLAEFLGFKSYMAVAGTRRLVVTPHAKRFVLREFDPVTGQDESGEVMATEAEKRELLGALARRFELDEAELVDTARQRGFLGARLADALDVEGARGAARAADALDAAATR